MVLKAHHLRRARQCAGREEQVADHALLCSLGVEGDGADEAALLPRVGEVVLAQQLVAAADGEHRGVVLDEAGELAGLGVCPSCPEVVEQGALVEVLAAADEEEVELGQVGMVSHAHAGDARLDAAPLAALLQGDGVAPVPVEVQHIRIQMTNAQFTHALS